MSLSGALNSAVSGLNSQASALAMIATNLANSSTTGYKSITASFSTMLNGGGSSRTGAVGGVTVSGFTNVAAQGLPTTTSTTTNMFISGGGFFVTTSSPGTNDYSYTRNGEFDLDPDGNIYNKANGQFLQGWPTDKDGKTLNGTSEASLEAMNINNYATMAGPTTSISMKPTNLPANAPISTTADPVTYESTLEVFDSLGTPATIKVTWEKTAENTWSAKLGDPTAPAAKDGTPGAVLGSITAGADLGAITFDGRGNLLTPTDAAEIMIDWDTGAVDDNPITFNFGEVGTASGLYQLNQPSGELSIKMAYDKDGIALTALNTILIDKGTVYASYRDGSIRAIYQVPIATFANPNGLTASSGGLYAESGDSGSRKFTLAGEDAAGDVYGSQLEMSTTDTNKEFANMMAAQQAYSGNAQVMTAANDMFDTLIGAVR